MRKAQNGSVQQVTKWYEEGHLDGIVGVDLCVDPFNLCVDFLLFSPHVIDPKFSKTNKIFSMDKGIPPWRKPLRLPNIDYSESGAYFITIMVQGRTNIFGQITAGTLTQTPAGEMVANWWVELEKKFSGLTPYEFVVMPNHFHGIIVIESDDHSVTLGQAVQWFKTMTTNEYIRGVRRSGWEPFDGKLWQRNYYEHIIRSEDDFTNAVLYIQENPNRWDSDDEYPYG